MMIYNVIMFAYNAVTEFCKCLVVGCT